MSDIIIVALISLCGTAFGTFGGIITSNKLSMYRIEQLEKEVREHNAFAKRMPVVEEKIKVINHRLDDLEKANNNTNSKEKENENHKKHNH